MFALLILSLTTRILAQNPSSLLLRTTCWPEDAKPREGLCWGMFSKQYFCLSDWNASGLSVDYSAGSGATAAWICRDGISGFSWYHLYLSHERKFKKVSGILQIRFSLTDMKGRPPAFRLGGNIRTTWSLSQTLRLQVSLYDFPGWLLPATAIAGGDPVMQFQLFHDTGRQAGLTAGLRISRLQAGPLTLGIRVNMYDRIGLTGLFDVLPFGLMIGINYRLKRYDLKGWLGQGNGMGLTPLLEISGN